MNLVAGGVEETPKAKKAKKGKIEDRPQSDEEEQEDEWIYSFLQHQPR